MRRTSSKDTARSRILDDDAIKLVWNACEGTFGDLVKPSSRSIPHTPHQGRNNALG